MTSAIQSAPLADLAILGILFGFFVFGVTQGTIRSVMGLLAESFAFLVAANLRGPVGGYLADNWHQFPPDYNKMLAFLVIFVVLGLGSLITIEGFYHRVDLSANHPILDDVSGGLLGLLQGIVLLMIVVTIIGSYPFTSHFPDEFGQLQWAHDVLFNQSNIGPMVRDTLVPFVFQLIGGLLPSDLVKAFS